MTVVPPFYDEHKFPIKVTLEQRQQASDAITRLLKTFAITPPELAIRIRLKPTTYIYSIAALSLQTRTNKRGKQTTRYLAPAWAVMHVIKWAESR